MILRCPSCSTHVELPAPPPGHDGGVAECPRCDHVWGHDVGHVWPGTSAVERTVEAVLPARAAAGRAAVPDLEVQRLIAAGRHAQEAFMLHRRKRQATAAAWFALAIFALSPAGIALAFPEKLVAAAPASIGLYDWLGRDVNIYGLEIRSVEMQHLLVEGQRVIAIRGSIVNVSKAERKIPWLRFGLKSADHNEVYRWQLDTEQRPIRPGEERSFVTRLASPPENADSVEIRFARTEEIGSNTTP